MDYSRRVDDLQASMVSQGIDLAAIFHPNDLFYFTGISLLGILLIPSSGEPQFLVQINHFRAIRECWIKDIRPSFGVKSLVEIINTQNLGRFVLGTELDVIPVNLYSKLQALLPGASIVNISEIIVNSLNKESKNQKTKLISSDTQLTYQNWGLKNVKKF